MRQLEKTRARPLLWISPLMRAVISIVIGLVITFLPDHSATVGLMLFGAYALITGVTLASVSWFTVADRSTRSLFVIEGIVGVVVGVFALAVNGGGLALFLYLISVWAAITAVLELIAGLRRTSSPSRRDWIGTGVLTAALALFTLLVPQGPVVAVGVFGAYAIVVGVFLAIGAVSLAVTPKAKESHSG